VAVVVVIGNVIDRFPGRILRLAGTVTLGSALHNVTGNNTWAGNVTLLSSPLSSDTIGADAGKDMGMHLSLSTDVIYLGCSTEVATLFWSHVENFQDFLVRVLIPANDLAVLLIRIRLGKVPASAPYI